MTITPPPRTQKSWPESVKNHIDLEYLHTVRPQEYWNSTVLPPKEERGNGEGKGEGGEECDVDYKYVSGETREEDFVMWMGGSNITAELVCCCWWCLLFVVIAGN